ncbi:hypothetical protein BZA77DRAFT_321762 [Pyronema omphalodes]|nr:hypothetical protein BZA77DRAFT_321762 [Pyronema omphalodes]
MVLLLSWLSWDLPVWLLPLTRYIAVTKIIQLVVDVRNISRWLLCTDCAADVCSATVLYIAWFRYPFPAVPLVAFLWWLWRFFGSLWFYGSLATSSRSEKLASSWWSSKSWLTVYPVLQPV